MKRKMALLFLPFLTLALYAEPTLEEYFNLCLEFGAPLEVVELFQSFRAYKGETNGSTSHVAREDNSLLKGTPYSEYQIWYTVDKELGLYQSTLILRGDRPVLQSILTRYLKKFNELHGEPVYTNLDNGSLLIFWYDENIFSVKARLILDIVNPYKFVSITYCSPQPKHSDLLITLYHGTVEDKSQSEISVPSPDADTQAAAVEMLPAENSEGGEEQELDEQ